MNIFKRPISEDDKELTNNWLLGWKQNPLPLTMYPNTGVVFTDENLTPIFIGYIWTTNSKMAQIGFITRNPFVKKIPKGTRKNLIKELIIEAKNMGYMHIFTTAENPFLIKDMKELGMTETSNKCSEFVIFKLI